MLRPLALLIGLLIGTSAAAAGDFDYYVLALSWSPAYCRLHEGDRDQCAKGYGFVLHGLWPQYERGGYPEHCQSGGEAMSEAARKVGAMAYPSPFLAMHEWESHGRCTGLSALDYFRAADKAFAAVKIPTALEAPAAPLTLSFGALAGAFQNANSSLRPSGIVAICKGPALSEVRLCLDKDLNPRSCGAGVRSHCRGAVTVDPIR